MFGTVLKALASIALNWCSDLDETVCDPFMGSGTTGVACIKLGRPFVGIEIEPRWFDLAHPIQRVLA